MKEILLLAAYTLLAGTASAADPGLDLAKSTDKFMSRHEKLLARVATQGDQDAYVKEIHRPATAELHRWPSMGDDRIDRYRFCAFALAQFINYADDQFKAGGRLPKTALSARDYFEQRRRCRSAIGKK